MIRVLEIQKQIIHSEIHAFLGDSYRNIKSTINFHVLTSRFEKLLASSKLWISSPVAEVRCINAIVDQIAFNSIQLIDWKVELRNIVFNANQIEQ